MIRFYLLGMLSELAAPAVIAAGMLGLVSAGLALTGQGPRRRDLPVLWVLFFFLTLTQYPFPDWAATSCPMPYMEPRFWPGSSVGHVIGQIEAWGWKVAFFKDRTVPTAVMNFAICWALGLAAAFQGRLSNRAILILGAVMTLTVEFTQLTGTWGLFPCAYRKFDADDLVLNFAGVAAGLYLGRWLGWSLRRGPG